MASDLQTEGVKNTADALSGKTINEVVKLDSYFPKFLEISLRSYNK